MMKTSMARKRSVVAETSPHAAGSRRHLRGSESLLPSWSRGLPIVFIAATALLGACSGEPGAQGPVGPSGQDGTDGTDGTDGQQGQPGDPGAPGQSGKVIVISDRAKLGLDISPVPITLDGLT